MRPAERRRVAILLACYPRRWRTRYGGQFGELLRAELAAATHDPAGRGWRLALDVAAPGLRARCSAAGLGSTPVPGGAGVGLRLTCLGIFLAGAASIWTQLVSGWQVAHPDSATVLAGVSLLTVTGVALSGLAVSGLAVSGLAVSGLRAFGRAANAAGRTARLRCWLTGLAASGLVAGGVVLAASRPGGASGPAGRAAGFGWAETLAVSTFWLHPHDLVTLPAAQLAWMVISPLLAALIVASLAGMHRGLDDVARCPPPRWAGRRLTAALLPGLAGAAGWVTSSHHDPLASYRAGSLDLVVLAAMALAVATLASAAGPTVPASTGSG